jgi:putrescine---pyruvate transaminase
MTAFWHPFADMHAVAGQELVLDRAEGVWVWDAEGTRLLDGTASLWCVNIGHGRREVLEAIERQLATLATYQCFGPYSNRPAMELCERLAALAPVDDAKVFLGSGGGDAIDTAAKMARRSFAAKGQAERVHLISRSQGYHGTHGLGTSLGGIPANRQHMGPLDPNASQVPHDDLAALEAEIERVGPDRVAAFFAEPVIGAGGVHLPPEGYLEGAAELCRRHGILFVADCIIVGFGRVGEWFGPERWGIRPDLITFAKGVTSGYLPLGGVVAAGHVAEPFFAGEAGTIFRHGATYAGHPTCAAAALANLDVLEREGLVARGRELEGPVEAMLRQFEGHPLVGEVRAGVGAVGAIAFGPEAPAGAPNLLWAEARRRGVLVRPLGEGIAVSPPLTIEQAELDLLGEAIGASLDALAAVAA